MEKLTINQIKKLNHIYNFDVIYVKLSQLNYGDTVIYQNKIHTVSKSNLKYNNFDGYTFYGDSYKLGTTKIQKVLFYSINEKGEKKYYK